MSDENMKKPEPMAEFFNNRADTYENHMRKDVPAFDRMYCSVCACIPATQSRINILDIGCGTGLELEGIFRKAPNARVFGIDVSEKMLDRLRASYPGRARQMTLLCANYLDYAFGEGGYDCALSIWSLHHLLPETKGALYKRIRESLKPGGIYVEGDYGVSAEKEKESLANYYRMSGALKIPRDGEYHIDVTLSLQTQVRLLTDAGFERVRVVWQDGNGAVYLSNV